MDTSTSPPCEEAPPEPRALFAEANTAYESGDYEMAIATYLDVVDMGVVDEDLYYNLGNAFYKTGQLGPAILYYERARRLAPRNDDINQNLSTWSAVVPTSWPPVGPIIISRPL